MSSTTPDSVSHSSQMAPRIPFLVPKAAYTVRVATLGHCDVAIERGPVLNGQPAHLDVAVKASRAAQHQAALRGDVARHLAADAHVRPFDRGLDTGAEVDRDTAARLELTLDLAGDLQVALDLETALQNALAPRLTTLIPAF